LDHGRSRRGRRVSSHTIAVMLTSDIPRQSIRAFRICHDPSSVTRDRAISSTANEGNVGPSCQTQFYAWVHRSVKGVKGQWTPDAPPPRGASGLGPSRHMGKLAHGKSPADTSGLAIVTDLLRLPLSPPASLQYRIVKILLRSAVQLFTLSTTTQNCVLRPERFPGLCCKHGKIFCHGA
jgi:hypothetical protein